MQKSTHAEHEYLGWVQYQLANDFGIELSKDEIWWAIFNDAGRQKSIADEMLTEFAGNMMALSEFAQTLKTTKPKLVIVDAPAPPPSQMISLVMGGVMLGFMMGIATTLVLSGVLQ